MFGTNKPSYNSLTAWRYATPSTTTTTASANDPNAQLKQWGKANNLARATSKAVKGILEDQAHKGAQDVVNAAGDTGYKGLVGEFGAKGAGADGEWALGGEKFAAGAENPNWSAPAAEDLKLSYASGEAAPAGEASMAFGGTASDAVTDAASSAADTAGQTVADLGASTYGDMVADMGTNFAQDAATEAATETAGAAANAVPIAGTALNIGANLAQGKYGAAAGAGAGAAMGSVIPGVGTALGGTIGGLLGSFF